MLDCTTSSGLTAERSRLAIAPSWGLHLGFASEVLVIGAAFESSGAGIDSAPDGTSAIYVFR
jgi:hypothetical protein